MSSSQIKLCRYFHSENKTKEIEKPQFDLSHSEFIKILLLIKFKYILQINELCHFAATFMMFFSCVVNKN